MNRKLILLLIVALLACLALPAGWVAGARDALSAAEFETLTGVLTIIFGDPQPMEGVAPVSIPPQFTLNTVDGRAVRVLSGNVTQNDLFQLNGREVVAVVSASDAAAPAGTSPDVMTLLSIAPAATDRAAPALSGNFKWLTVTCQFNDIPTQPKPLSFFAGMYANSYPGLDHYWREASYNAINLAGSSASGWHTLPNSNGYYSAGPDLVQLFYDCTALADPNVNFSEIYGVNLMLNGNLGCCAWGGSVWATLDGVTKAWPATWLPPWAFEKIAVIEHEMGHGFGLPHSYAGNNPYGNPWDVMSMAEYNCAAATDPLYGCVGQQTIAYNRHSLGWIPDERVITAGTGTTTFTLERTTQPGQTGYSMAVIPINGSTSHYYTVEARQRVGYDFKLPGDWIVIHEINGQNGTMWADPIVGAPLYHWQPQNDYSLWDGGVWVHVDTATASGYAVTVSNGLETDTVIHTSTADTYVDGATPEVNYGSSPKLFSWSYPCSETSRSSMLRFDEPVPPLISRIRIRLYAYAVGETNLPHGVPFSETYYGSALPWTESGLNWSNAWGGGGGVCGWDGPVSEPQWSDHWLEWDITPMVAVHGVGPFAVQGGNRIAYSSREGPKPPQLVIDYLIPPYGPNTHTFTPTDDASVLSSQKQAVFNQSTLPVRDANADKNAYIRFDVSELTGNVESATLRLYVQDHGPDGGGVYVVSPFYKGTTTLWLETGLKWINAPVIEGAPLDTAGAVVMNTWIDLDVTSAVAAAVGGNGLVSLALTNDSADQVAFSSKEGTHPPQLLVTTP
jgi:M6 family metalloprotease-like protein